MQNKAAIAANATQHEIIQESAYKVLLNADNLVVIESIGSIRRLKKSQVYVRSWFGYKPAVQKRKVGKPARIILVAVVYVCTHSCSVYVYTHL